MATRSRPPADQGDSLKARKADLFEADEPAALAGSGTPFQQFLRETPADPLPLWLKAALWVAGLVVGLLLILAILRMT